MTAKWCIRVVLITAVCGSITFFIEKPRPAPPIESVGPVFSGTIVQTECTATIQKYKYDTPSGDLDPGYYDPTHDIGSVTDATSGKPSIIANYIGMQNYEVCTDQAKKQYERTITPAEYTAFKQGQPLPSVTVVQ